MDDVVPVLNKILCNELTAINQYYLHAKMHADWGFHKLAEKLKAESIEEMHHADQLIERILLLGGLPNLQQLGKLMIGENAVESLKCDMKVEEIAINDLREAITACEQAKDYVSRNLLMEILKLEEEHVDWMQTQLQLIDKIGEQRYLQTQV